MKIWNPRWHDRTVLIAKHKVRPGTNRITFTKANTLKGITFTMEGKDITQYPVESNGKINCYAVPLEHLGVAQPPKF